METIDREILIEETRERNEILLEQWKVYVQMADNMSVRRSKSNSFFTTINTTIIGLISVSFFSNHRNLILITGILISIAWISSIRSYKILNNAKFKVINKIEESFPMQGFTEEWDELKKSKHIKLTSNETYVPIGFIIIYMICLWNNSGAFIWLINLFK
ncbi:hypothetical protein [uncultured Clostridium sp.]|uniref:RipA family octameric membrane protein n=1 Tax=uncultured Clostridium sp. TaxID=59620 RepID=UPI002604A149|nr:hypothetical protein [uncultured Clostridium sp.]